ncbi:MAG: cyclic peptide export ABC transporter [Terracidiphilus sp.]
MKDLFELLGYLARIAGGQSHPRKRIALIAFAGVASGCGNIVLIAIVNSFILAHGIPGWMQATWFGALCLLVAGSRFLSQYLLASMASNAVLTLRMRLCRQILSTPLKKLEEVGSSRLLAHLTDDVSALSEAVVQIPVLIVNAAIVIAAFCYMGWLSWGLLLFILVSMALGVVFYQAPVARSMNLFRQSRENWNGLFAGFQGVTRGIKELQLHAGRQKAFYEGSLLNVAKKIQQLGLRGYTILAAANSWGQILFFVVLGAILFAAPRLWSINPSVASGYALVLLFLIGPIEAILNALPAMARAHASTEQLDKMGLMLAEARDPSAAPAVNNSRWTSIELRGVTRTYFTEQDEKSFTLGPIDLNFQPGEIVFLVGGNGSGKTTLAKLIVGLYEPERGSILLDDEPVEDFRAYRQMFSAIFSDFHLFDSLAGVAEGDLDSEARRYLQILRLQNKVDIKQGQLSTLDLSQGQRKRLALLTAWMEDRPICLFDEWSSDQDPVYREIFYRQILPGLRESSKAVIVISHDDRYFDIADRVIELDYGQIRNPRSIPATSMV